MTFNILVPKNTGTCTVSQLASDLNFRDIVANKNLNEKLMYITTQSTAKSLYDVQFISSVDHYYYIFQILYTLVAFGKIGLIQNDLHSANIRIQMSGTKRPVKFIIDEVTSYNVMVDKVPMIYDFDYAGMDNPISDLLGKFKLPNKNLAGEGICKDLSVCNDADQGRRDTLVFLARYMFSFYDAVHYITSNPKYSPDGMDYINKTFKKNGKTFRDFNNIIKEIKQSNTFLSWEKIYNDILELLIFMCNGKVKMFFQSIQDKSYIPANKKWQQDFKNRGMKQPPTNVEWLFDLLYRNKIPECPLPIPLDEKTMLSPYKLLKSDNFKKFIEQSEKINKLGIVPEQEVSIDISYEQISREYSRFMTEYFNL